MHPAHRIRLALLDRGSNIHGGTIGTPRRNDFMESRSVPGPVFLIHGRRHLTIAPMAASINIEATYNLVPLVNMFSWLAPGSVSPAEWVKFYLENILGNLFLLMPLGFFLPLISKSFRRFRNVCLTAFATTVLIESIQFVSQYFGSVRTADVDDVILNTLGACGGFYIFRLLYGLLDGPVEPAEC